jgi:hypothetical protein
VLRFGSRRAKFLQIPLTAASVPSPKTIPLKSAKEETATEETTDARATDARAVSRVKTEVSRAAIATLSPHIRAEPAFPATSLRTEITTRRQQQKPKHPPKKGATADVNA